jgi:hypothetical protein
MVSDPARHHHVHHHVHHRVHLIINRLAVRRQNSNTTIHKQTKMDIRGRWILVFYLVVMEELTLMIIKRQRARDKNFAINF